MMTPRERFKATRNATLDRWVAESMPVEDLSNMKQVNIHLLGKQNQVEGISPKRALLDMGKCNNPPTASRILSRRVRAFSGF